MPHGVRQRRIRRTIVKTYVWRLGGVAKVDQEVSFMFSYFVCWVRNNDRGVKTRHCDGGEKELV